MRALIIHTHAVGRAYEEEDGVRWQTYDANVSFPSNLFSSNTTPQNLETLQPSTCRAVVCVYSSVTDAGGSLFGSKRIGPGQLSIEEFSWLHADWDSVRAAR